MSSILALVKTINFVPMSLVVLALASLISAMAWAAPGEESFAIFFAKTEQQVSSNSVSELITGYSEDGSVRLQLSHQMRKIGSHLDAVDSYSVMYFELESRQIRVAIVQDEEFEYLKASLKGLKAPAFYRWASSQCFVQVEVQNYKVESIENLCAGHSRQPVPEQDAQVFPTY